MEAEAKGVAAGEERRKLSVFFIGLVILLAGVGLLWLGDGHDSRLRNGLVVLGLMLSIGGIVTLRFLLVAPFLSWCSRKK